MRIGDVVRYTAEYLQSQYGDLTRTKELFFVTGVILAIKKMVGMAESYATVAWDDGLTYQVVVKNLERLAENAKDWR